MKLEINSNDLKKTTEICAAELETKLIEKQLEIHWQETSCNTLANFDSQRLSQVMSNLLSNAIKFTKPNQSIFIGDGTGLGLAICQEITRLIRVKYGLNRVLMEGLYLNLLFLYIDRYQPLFK